VLQSIANRMMILPGLGLVREAGDHLTLRRWREPWSQRKLSWVSILSLYFVNITCAIAKLLESGAVVDDAFVKALLSNEGPSTPLVTGT
jgi:hypothetical protein